MKLRTRLFVWIGALFLIAFGLSFLFDNYITKRNLIKAEETLEVEIKRINEIKRKHFESFLKKEVERAQANIDSVLLKIGYYPHIRANFSPTRENIRTKTYLNSSSLKITNPWIDFIQNIAEEEVLAGIISEEEEPNQSRYYPINEEMILVSLKTQGQKEWSSPKVGVKIHYNFDTEEIINISSSYYALFEPEQMLEYDAKVSSYRQIDLSLDFLDPFLRWIEVPARRGFFEVFITNYGIAQEYLKKELQYAGSLERWKTEASKKVFSFQKNREWMTPGSRLFHQIIDRDSSDGPKADFNAIISRYNQIGMTWGLSTIMASGAFSEDPYSKKAPVGIAHIVPDLPVMDTLLTKQVFLPKAIPLTPSCQASVGKKESYCLSAKLSLIEDARTKRLFIGNTLDLVSQGKKGMLTIGIDSKHFLKDLAKATNEYAALIANGELMGVVDHEGSRILSDHWNHLDIQKLTSSNEGLITIDGAEYYFLHLQPYDNLDFHLVIFDLKEKEFALLDSITRASKQLIARISWDLRIAGILSLCIVLIILHYLSVSITKPIAFLANATKKVSKGHLENLTPRKRLMERKDEVGTLYRSFFEMIDGLREKEKVRGILNKVVSPEIAEEALKGQIHLGGEEKEISVLFADIRGFTTLTEKMSPQDVIQLLNECMTKISHLIDEFGGVIDKYVGDEVMALFGAPVSSEDHAQKSVACALKIMEELEMWNQERAKQNLDPIQMGIGIHTGVVLAGNMGAENRLNYTVLGANVNLASRLCSYAKPLQILISENTWDHIQAKQQFQIEKCDEISLKGFKELPSVFIIKQQHSS